MQRFSYLLLSLFLITCTNNNQTANKQDIIISDSTATKGIIIDKDNCMKPFCLSKVYLKAKLKKQLKNIKKLMVINRFHSIVLFRTLRNIIFLSFYGVINPYYMQL